LRAWQFRLQVNILRYNLPVIDSSEKDGKLTFKVHVVPRASRSEIAGEHNGALRVRLAAPPVDGAANEELIRTLARALKLPRSAIEIAAGHRSKLKRVCVTGTSAKILAALVHMATERGCPSGDPASKERRSCE
jgi:uncharacterized protein (TIGR00251 family)